MNTQTTQIPTNAGTSAQLLKGYVNRIERLAEEKQGIADDIKDIYNEAKAEGFDVKALRQVIRRNKLDVNEKVEFDALVETYEANLG